MFIEKRDSKKSKENKESKESKKAKDSSTFTLPVADILDNADDSSDAIPVDIPSTDLIPSQINNIASSSPLPSPNEAATPISTLTPEFSDIESPKIAVASIRNTTSMSEVQSNSNLPKPLFKSPDTFKQSSTTTNSSVKLGIAIPLAVVLTILIGLVSWFYFRHKKNLKRFSALKFHLSYIDDASRESPSLLNSSDLSHVPGLLNQFLLNKKAKAQPGVDAYLEHLESVYKQNALVTNVMLVEQSSKLVAVVQLNEKEIEKKVSLYLANIEETVLMSLRTTAYEHELLDKDVINDVVISYDEWTARNGLLTPKMSLQRIALKTKYQSEIATIFGRFMKK